MDFNFEEIFTLTAPTLGQDEYARLKTWHFVPTIGLKVQLFRGMGIGAVEIISVRLNDDHTTGTIRYGEVSLDHMDEEQEIDFISRGLDGQWQSVHFNHAVMKERLGIT